MKEKNYDKIKEGIFFELDYISPSYIDKRNPKYLEIDGLKYCGLLITNYNRQQQELILKKLIEININMNISIFYEKSDYFKTIKELTYYIGNTGVELKENIKKNREDIEIIEFANNDAQYIRKEMQINN